MIARASRSERHGWTVVEAVSKTIPRRQTAGECPRVQRASTGRNLFDGRLGRPLGRGWVFLTLCDDGGARTGWFRSLRSRPASGTGRLVPAGPLVNGGRVGRPRLPPVDGLRRHQCAGGRSWPGCASVAPGSRPRKHGRGGGDRTGVPAGAIHQHAGGMLFRSLGWLRAVLRRHRPAHFRRPRPAPGHTPRGPARPKDSRSGARLSAVHGQAGGDHRLLH